jgi:spore germination cell wall hydrolase CwlJ-like protein
MAILKLFWACCLSGFILLSPSITLGNTSGTKTSTNVQVNYIQEQKKRAILEKLKQANLISSEIKMLEKSKREDVECLALNIYHEARGSSIQDRIASSYVVFNRYEDSSYPLTSKKSSKSLCDVIFDKYQFCWTNNDVIPLPAEKQAWEDSQTLAYKLYENPVHKELAKKFGLKHYVVTSLVYDKHRPKWINKRTFTEIIGAHSYMSLIDTDTSSEDIQMILKQSYNAIFGSSIKDKIIITKR